MEIQQNDQVVDVPSEKDERKETRSLSDVSEMQQKEDLSKTKKYKNYKDLKEITKETLNNKYFLGGLMNNPVYRKLSAPLTSTSGSHENEEKIVESNDKSNEINKNLKVENTKTKQKETEDSLVKYKLIRASDTQFEKLKFSHDAEFLSEIKVEIEEDLDEFVNCMKNSVFYGSGINRFYNQELDKFRRKFIELEANKNRWQYYIFKYIKDKNPKVIIPAPLMSDEIEVRTKIITKIREINSIVNLL